MVFIDITQDGAGLIDSNAQEINGLFTGFVSTCCVYVFYSDKRLCLIHDTGQLVISNLCEIANKCGHINSAFYAINPFEITKGQANAHKIRRERIKNILKLKNGFKKIDIPDGNLLCTSEGQLLTRDQDILSIPFAEMSNIPQKEVRKRINELNNLFSAKNSQSIPVDFQFDIDHYTDLPKLLKSKDELKAIAKLKFQQGDSDYQFFLEKARQDGLPV